MSELLKPPGLDAVVVGAGRLTLDVIVRTGGESVEPRCQAGGTCGNVMANLAYLGWQTYPLTDIGTDDPGDRFCRDLARWGVHLDLIDRHSDQETPVIIHHINQTDAGAVHSFSSRCPFCDARLRYYEPLPLAGVQRRLSRVPVPKVYFFDRDSEGSLLLARHCRDQGALVVYEPNYAGPESNLDAALAVCHLLKVSSDKLHTLVESHPLRGPMVVIETMGSGGLRWRDQRQEGGVWEVIPARQVMEVRDAGGSGDWCTAGFLHVMGRKGAEGLRTATPEQIREALGFGQALGAWNCAFEGARGGVFTVDRERFRRGVGRILSGERIDPGEGTTDSTYEPAGRFCPKCGGTPN